MRKSWRSHTEARIDGKPGYPIVEIIWNDAQASALEWQEEAGTSMAPTTTVGYLVAKDRGSYTVASLINLNHVGHCITIPKGCLIEKPRYLVLAPLA